MVKLLVFAILLASTPATAMLLDKLYDSESNCYSVCAGYYNDESLYYCKRGCDFTLLNENCQDQCKSVSDDKAMQDSCQRGCESSDQLVDNILNSPEFAVDPIPDEKTSESPATVASTTAVAANEPEIFRPHSIILIRLRQRPSIQFPSMNSFFGNDPVQMFNNMIQQFQDHAKNFEEAIRSQLANNAGDNQQIPNLQALSDLPKAIPMLHMQMQPFDGPAGEQNDHQRMMHAFHHHFGHPHGLLREGNAENVEPENGRVRQFFTDVRTEWNDLVRKQPKIPIWIFLAVFLSSSVILWYMVMSLCRHAPNRDALSIRAQEVVFHPYDYESYEKAKIQPDDDTYDVAESVPIKVKLTNI